MNATAPWWASGLFGVLGALIGSLATLSLGVLNRRTVRRRLSRAEKVALYPSLTRAANKLARLRAWPAETGDPEDLLDTIDGIANDIAFLAPANVATTVIDLLAAAEKLSDAVRTIRQGRPGYGNTVAKSQLAPLTAATGELKAAIQAYGTASRADLEITTPYVALYP